MLRYYNEICIFKTDGVDKVQLSFTTIKLYTVGANHVFRELEIPLADIKAILDNPNCADSFC